MIGAPVPGVVNALQVTIPGRSPFVPSVKALGNARDEKKTARIWQKEWYKNLDTYTRICGDISQNVSVNSLLCQPVQCPSYVPTHETCVDNGTADFRYIWI